MQTEDDLEELSFDDLKVDVVVPLPSFGKSITVRPYLPEERVKLQSELLPFTHDGDEIDAKKMKADQAAAYTGLGQRIASEVCFIGGKQAFEDEKDDKLRRLHQADLEAITDAAMSGGNSLPEGFADRRKKSQTGNSD